MAYILENDVLKLECAGKGGEMLHLVKKSTDHETLYQGDQGGLVEILLYFQW